jgi:hypothetical protein
MRLKNGKIRSKIKRYKIKRRNRCQGKMDQFMRTCFIDKISTTNSALFLFRNKKYYFSRRERFFMTPQIKLLFLCLFLAFYSGCDDGDQVNQVINNDGPTKLLTLSVNKSYNTSKSEDWIIIHDEDGKILASQSFEANEKIELETSEKLSANTIGITFLKITDSKREEYFLIKSYLNIEKGKTALLRTKTETDPGKNEGIFELILNSTTSPDQFSLSSKNGMLYSGGLENRKLKLKGFLYSKSSDYLFQMSDLFGNARYKMIKKIKPNDHYSFAFDDLDPFDKIVEFNFPVSNRVDLSVRGRTSDQSFDDPGYTLNNHFISDNHSQIKVGYLNDLSKYETELTLKYFDYGYVYKKVGSIPDGNISWPSNSAFRIKESAIENFSAEAAPFIWRQSTWNLKNSDVTRPDVVVWDIYSSSPGQSLTELPEEITSAHPTLTLKKLTHKGTTFYTQSESYANYIDKILNGADKAATEEQVGIVVY